MPNIDFDTLVLKSDWAEALQTILNDAQTAIQANDNNRKLELQGQLKIFIKRSPLMVDALDDIAFKTIDTLTLSVLDSAIAGIKSRNDELKAATGAIEATTKQATKDANALKFKNIIDALDRAKAAVETLKALEKTLADPDQNLLTKIGDVSTAIEALIALAKAKQTP